MVGLIGLQQRCTCWRGHFFGWRQPATARPRGDLPDHPWWQATTWVSCGGLGLRTFRFATLLAFVASRITCRPLVTTIVDHFSAVFGTPINRFWLSTTRAQMRPSRALSPPSPPRSRKTCLPSSIKPCPNVNSCGATCLLGLKTPRATCPLRHAMRSRLPSRAASLSTSGRSCSRTIPLLISSPARAVAHRS